jgi:hypothetical protein
MQPLAAATPDQNVRAEVRATRPTDRAANHLCPPKQPSVPPQRREYRTIQQRAHVTLHNCPVRQDKTEAVGLNPSDIGNAKHATALARHAGQSYALIGPRRPASLCPALAVHRGPRCAPFRFSARVAGRLEQLVAACGAAVSRP